MYNHNNIGVHKKAMVLTVKCLLALGNSVKKVKKYLIKYLLSEENGSQLKPGSESPNTLVPNPFIFLYVRRGYLDR